MPVPKVSFFGVEFIIYYTVHVHGYLSMFVCAFGSIANVFNMIVFTRKHMISPINTILCFLALVDLIVLLSYLPFAWYFYLRPNSDPYEWCVHTYEWAFFMQWQSQIMDVFFNTSIWLTALVSLWRYIGIAYPLKNRIWYNMRNILKTVALVFLLCVLPKMPFFFNDTISSITLYNFNAEFVGYNSSIVLSEVMLKVNCSMDGVFFCLLPTVLITALSMKLLIAFSKMKKAEANFNTAYTRNEKQLTRTTLILIILTAVCVITQLPQSTMHLSIYFLDKQTIGSCISLLKEFVNIMALGNSAFTLVIYYAISEQFRETFKALFDIKSTQEATIMECAEIKHH